VNTRRPVNTLAGPVDSDRLGPTLMHEHVIVCTPELDLNRPEYWRDEELLVNISQGLKRLSDNGVSTIVDLTVMGIGQSIPILLQVARSVDLNIVVATGFYTFNELPRNPMFMNGYRTNDAGFAEPDFSVPTDRPDPLEEKFVRDIEVGIEQTGVRAGVLKCVTEVYGVTTGIERVLRAVARTQLRTGVPISTHSHPGTRNGLEQQRIFREEGVDLSRVVIGHSGDSQDLDYLQSLIQNGSYIGMDRFGARPPGVEARMDVFAELCKRGFADRMVLSHDCALHYSSIARIDEKWLVMQAEVLPGLRERGVPESDINQMMVVNPAQVLMPNPID